MIWNAQNSSMSADGIITMNGANINNGTIKQVGNNPKRWLNIQDGKITGGSWEVPAGSSTPVYTEAGSISMISVDGIFNYISIDSNDMLYLSCESRLDFDSKSIHVRERIDDSNYREGFGRSGNYISDVTKKTFKQLWDEYVTVLYEDGKVISVTCDPSSDNYIAVNPVTREMINGIGTYDIVT